MRVIKIDNEANLLTKKNLQVDIFKPVEIKLDDPIEKHAAWAFNHIYSVPYPGIPRGKWLDKVSANPSRLYELINKKRNVARAFMA